MNNVPTKQSFVDVLKSEEYQRYLKDSKTSFNQCVSEIEGDISRSPLELLKEAEKKIRIKCIDLFLIGVLVGMMIMQLLILVVKMQN